MAQMYANATHTDTVCTSMAAPGDPFHMCLAGVPVGEKCFVSCTMKVCRKTARPQVFCSLGGGASTPAERAQDGMRHGAKI